MTGKHYVGEIGTEILLDTKVDITTATNTKIKCKKPDATTVDWTATIKETTKLSYIIVSGDFNQTGLYMVQASLTLGGWTGLGETATFMVLSTYK
jgi:hypothetical protein